MADADFDVSNQENVKDRQMQEASDMEEAVEVKKHNTT